MDKKERNRILLSIAVGVAVVGWFVVAGTLPKPKPDSLAPPYDESFGTWKTAKEGYLRFDPYTGRCWVVAERSYISMSHAAKWLWSQGIDEQLPQVRCGAGDEPKSPPAHYTIEDILQDLRNERHPDCFARWKFHDPTPGGGEAWKTTYTLHAETPGFFFVKIEEWRPGEDWLD